MEAVELARTVWNLLDTGRFDRLSEAFAPDAVFESGATVVRGPEAIGHLAARHYEAFPDTAHRVLRSVEDGATAAIELEVRATHTGTFRSVMGDLEATGRTLTWTATTWLEVADGRVTRWRTHYDSLVVLRQLDPAAFGTG